MLLVVCFALVVGVLADGFRSSYANDAEVQVAALIDTGSLSITVLADATCPNFDETHSELVIAVRAGYIAADCMTVHAATDATNGYSLTINGPSNGNLTDQDT